MNHSVEGVGRVGVTIFKDDWGGGAHTQQEIEAIPSLPTRKSTVQYKSFYKFSVNIK